ncbi:MAG: hypothetical protein ACREYE_10785 [Gammaproteobacteria bacterium]
MNRLVVTEINNIRNRFNAYAEGFAALAGRLEVAWQSKGPLGLTLTKKNNLNVVFEVFGCVLRLGLRFVQGPDN